MFEFSSAVNVKQCIYFSKQTIGRAIMCADTALRMEMSPLKARKRIKQLSFFNPAVSGAVTPSEKYPLVIPMTHSPL